MVTPNQPVLDNPLAMELAKNIFGYVPSFSVAGNDLVTVVEARLYMWDSSRNVFVLLMSNPQPNGTIDLQVIPEPITTRTQRNLAVQYADRAFRERALLPGLRTAQQWGFEVEDHLVQILRLLGFQDGCQIRDHHAHTVRFGTYNEDHLDKADIVLTMPSPLSPLNGVVVPLQVTTGAVRAGSKRDAIVSGQVAFLAISRFVPRAQLHTLLMAAIDNNGIERWFMAQVIRGAISQFLGKNITFPIEPATPLYVRKEPIFTLYRMMLQPKFHNSVNAIMGAKGSPLELRQQQATQAIENFRLLALPYFKDELYRVKVIEPQ